MERVHQLFWLFVAAAGMAMGQTAAASAAEDSSKDSIQGAWRAASMVQGGRAVPEGQSRQLMLVISEKKIVLRLGQRLVAETDYTIDAKAKPATIDMKFQGQETLGIYELAGERLRICLNDLGKGRPKKMPENAGAECDVDLRLERADRGWPVLHVVDPDGGNARRLVTHPEYTEQGSPEWSVDGSKIAFDACRTILGESWSTCHLLTCQANGQGLKDLGPGAMPSWSPDGKRIAFSCYNPRGVWIMNADGTNRELLDDEGWGAEWCPKANKIAYTHRASGGTSICVRDLEKKTSHDLLEGRYSQIYWGMAWSPDGRWIAFKGVGREKADLAVVNVEDEEKGCRVLASEGKGQVKHLMDNVSWTPDSKQVLTAFATPDNPAMQLHVVAIDGKTPPKPLPKQDKGRSYLSVAWSLDGKHILVTTPRTPR